MADNTETVETVKIFDIAQGKFIEKPASEVEVTNPIPENFNNEPEPTDDPKPGEEPKPREEPKPGEAPKAGEEPKPGEEPKKTDGEPAKTFEPGAYLNEKWGKYGVKSEDDVSRVFDEHLSLKEKQTQLQAELDKVKSEPKYRSEQEQKIAEFLAPFDPSKFGEGLNTIAELMAMDPANVSQRRALEEAYILKHPDLTREESKELFNEEYDSKYTVNRDDFDTDDAYNKRKRIVEIKLKNEEAEARKELVAKKDALKAAEKPKTDEGQGSKKDDAPTIPVETVNDYSKKIETVLKPGEGKVMDRLNYLSDDGKEVLGSVVFDKDQQENIRQTMLDFVKNPNSYGQDGKIPNFDPSTLHRSVARLLYGDFIEESLWKQVKAVAQKLKAEQIAGQSPEKKSGGQGDAKLSVDEQFRQQAAAAVKQREGR